MNKMIVDASGLVAALAIIVTGALALAFLYASDWYRGE